jgi:hypothetical protein
MALGSQKQRRRKQRLSVKGLAPMGPIAFWVENKNTDATI